MSDTYDLLTLAEAKVAINLANSITTFDTPLAAYITAVSRAIDGRFGPVVKRTITDELHTAKRNLFLRYFPVISVTTVNEYSDGTAQALTAESTTSLPDYGYLFDSRTGMIFRRSGGTEADFASGQLNVAVTYVAGRFDNTAAVDGRWKTAASMMLANLWRHELGGGTQTAGPLDTYGLVPTFSIPNAVLELLLDELPAPATA